MGPLKLVDTSEFRIKSDKKKTNIMWRTAGIYLSARLVRSWWNVYRGGRAVQKKWKEKWNILVQRCFYEYFYQLLRLSKYLLERENAPELIRFAIS